MQEYEAAMVLSSLAQESRLRVFRRLVSAGECGLAAGRIARELDIPAATLTFHLHQLEHAGLIRSRREGRSIIYSLEVEGMRNLLAFLMEDCCQGRPELCQPADDEVSYNGKSAASSVSRRKKTKATTKKSDCDGTCLPTPPKRKTAKRKQGGGRKARVKGSRE